MDVQLDANELRELFGELKQKLVNLYATQAPKKDIDRVMETVIKLELYMNADFRGAMALGEEVGQEPGRGNSTKTNTTNHPTNSGQRRQRADLFLLIKIGP
jgi:hypothetical protein